MNLHAIAVGAIARVNPQLLCWGYRNSGYITVASGKRQAVYAAPAQISAQIQPLANQDLQHLDGLNIVGDRQGIYLYGAWDAVVRQDRKGGDIIVEPNGTIWLVAYVFETWPDWCKVAATRQLKRATTRDASGAFILDFSSLGGQQNV